MNTIKGFLAVILILFIFAFVNTFLTQPAEESRTSYGMHYSSNGTKEFFDHAYRNISSEQPINQIVGMTVNHHLLAPHLIAKQFALVATEEPITVVLLSPNHFMSGRGVAITSRFDWQTPYGVLESHQDLTSKLLNIKLANADELPFEQEHGVSNLVGFIKKSIPNAQIIPLIIKDTMTDSQADELGRKLNDLLPKNTVVIGSLDFSHYLTSDGAKFHDIQSIATINNFDFDRIHKLDIDSQPGLRILLRIMELRNQKKYVLISHENSSTVTGDYSFPETTSYINGYFTSGQIRRDTHWTKLETGDYQVDHRLFMYNDETISNPDLDKMAIGYVYEDDKLTDVYIFPYDLVEGRVRLLPQTKVDKLKEDQLKQKILYGN